MSVTIGSGPLVGRNQELALLHARLATSATEASTVVVVSGDAGIGKSRLVAEARAHATGQGFLTLQGHCFEADRALPYGPILDLLLRSGGADAPAETTAALGLITPALLAMTPEVGLQFPGIAPAPPLDPEQARRRLSGAFTRAVTDLAASHPILLIIEDLHWCDEASLDLLLYVLRRLPARSALILLTYRSDDTNPALAHALAELDRARIATELALPALSTTEMAVLLRAIFRQEQSVRSEFLEAIGELTEGNPFFIEEVLKSLVMDGDIFYAAGRWDRKPIRALRIPRTIDDAIRRRVERLSAGARATLTLAAAIGQRVDLALLADLTGHDEQALLHQLKELLAAQLIVEESAERISFRHALTQRAIYATLLARERRALHQRIATMIEERYAASLDAHLNELAYHFSAAETWTKALEYARRAGQRAQAAYAPRAAVEHFTRAIAAAAALHLPPEPALLRARGQAREMLGDFLSAQADHEGALAAARDKGDRQAEWQALLDLGFLWASRDYARTGEYFQRGLRLASAMDAPALLAHSLNRLGNWYLNAARPLDAQRHHEQALAIFADLADRPGLAETLDLLGLATLHSGDVRQGAAHYERAIDLFRELGDRRGLVSSLVIRASIGLESFFAVTEVTIPARTTAERWGDEAIAVAREIGWRAGEAYALAELSNCLTAYGDYARALDMARDSLAIAEEIEHQQWLILAHNAIAGAYLHALAFPAARGHLERALALAQTIHSEYLLLACTLPLALGCVAQGDLAQAVALLDTLPETTGPSPMQRMIQYGRAEFALASGDPALALTIVERLIASAVNLTAGGVLPALWLVRGEASAALGYAAEAEAIFRSTEAVAHQRGLRPLLRRLHLALGKLYQGQGRRAEADSAFATARALAEELAAGLPDEPVTELGGESLRAYFLRAATAPLPSPRPLTERQAAKRNFGGLTAREQEVAALIARGLSNRALADALVISERTVTTHVTNALGKLGFTSRAQIAAWAVERGLGKAESR